MATFDDDPSAMARADREGDELERDDRDEPDERGEGSEDVGWEWERDLESQGHGGCWETSHLEQGFEEPDDGAASGPGQGARACRRSDVRIYEDVCDLLTDHPGVDARAIEVHVSDGVVVLRGAVGSHYEVALCCEVLDEVAGVRASEILVRVAPRRAEAVLDDVVPDGGDG